MSYVVVVYAAFAGLIALLVFVFWLMYASVDPAIIETALADNPAINELNEDELLVKPKEQESPIKKEPVRKQPEKVAPLVAAINEKVSKNIN